VTLINLQGHFRYYKLGRKSISDFIVCTVYIKNTAYITYEVNYDGGLICMQLFLLSYSIRMLYKSSKCSMMRQSTYVVFE